MTEHPRRLMTRPTLSRPHLVILGVVIVLVVTTVTVLLVKSGTDDEVKPVGGLVKIRTPDGIRLQAEVIEPKQSGRHPLLVMPTSWGSKITEYDKVATLFTRQGYLVLAYTQRGFSGSGGKVDFAGPRTQRDVRTVISWALKHTDADPGRIGITGASYGGGMSLLGAAADPRIKAVAALSTWTDMAASFAPNDTLSAYMLPTLFATARRTGTVDAANSKLSENLTGDPSAALRQLKSESPSHSAISSVAAINKNHPAVMIANAYEDSVFAPAQLVPFFEALTTPKRLQLAPGDHGGPERSGLDGKADETYADVLAWMDHYLRGKGNGIDKQEPVQLKDATTGAWHGYRSWPGTSGQVVADLAKPATSGVTTTTTPASWSANLTAGTDSIATSGPTAFLSAELYHPPVAQLAALSDKQAFVWSGPPSPTPLLISGSSQMHLQVSSSTGKATLFAYLYDVAPNATGTLMSVTPYTASGLTRGTPAPVTMTLEPTSWTVPAGHRVAVVMDTVDPRYRSAAPAGTTVTVSSSTADPATLSVPVER